MSEALTSRPSGPIRESLRARSRKSSPAWLGSGILPRLLMVAVPLAAGAWLYGNSLVEGKLTELGAQEALVVGRAVDRMTNHLQHIAGDLRFLSNEKMLLEALERPGPENLERLNDEFVAFSRAKGIYDQIRWLDETGRERVRVNYRKGTPRAVPPGNLQDKSRRYYFADTFRLQSGEIFVSPLDLNVEHGTIERPFQPMLRIGTPVFDRSGRKRGIILLNYLAANLLGNRSAGVSILNRNGYWLKSPKPGDAWGFMLGHRDATLAVRHPDAWQAILAKDRGSLSDDSGLWTWDTVYPLLSGMHSHSSAAGDAGPPGQTYFWKMVSHLDPATLNRAAAGIWPRIVGSVSVVLAVIGALLWKVTRAEREIVAMNTTLARQVDERTTLLRSKISELEQVRETLLRNEELLKDAKRLAGLGHWHWDLRSNEITASEEISRIYGRDPSLPPTPYPEVQEYFTPESWRILSGEVENAIATGGSYVCDAEVVRPDGEHRWIVARGQAVLDAHENPLELYGTLQDITERKKAEEALREQDQLLTDMSAMAHIGGWYFDPATGQGAWTPECARIHDLPEDAPIDVKGGLSYFVGRHRKAIEAAVRAAIEHGTPYDLEAKIRTATGGPKWIRTIGHPVVEEGRVVKVFGSIQDITERKRADTEIRQLNAELEQRVAARTAELSAAYRELESFSYAVSHDLRAPLRAMGGFSQALMEDFGDQLQGKARTYLEQIGIASRHMNELIDALLALSQSARGGLRYDSLDLSEMARRLLGELADGDPARRVAVEIEDGIQVHGDRSMIEVVLSNLLDNAWKYTARTADPRIQVYTEGRTHGYRRICVADNGTGFDPEHADKMFQPFQRLHRQDEFPGIGIGLATVQRILHRHGGSIDAAGKPNQGATFCFRLPDTLPAAPVEPDDGDVRT